MLGPRCVGNTTFAAANSEQQTNNDNEGYLQQTSVNMDHNCSRSPPTVLAVALRTIVGVRARVS